MKLFLIETRNGNFISMGETEHQAKINFTIEFPSEKIRTIKEMEEKSIQLNC
jgi:hypothetical protein